MADIRPFRGVLYNPEKIKDIAAVFTEPYDVIGPTQQKVYYQTHPCNVIRLILGKCYSRDNRKNNQYTRAKKFFAHWLDKEIILQDDRENIYIYAQTFPHHHGKKTRTGFIVLLKLEDFAKNTVLPHEYTSSPAVQDRLRLLKTVQANFSPIFSMFVDRQRKINKLLSQYKKTHHPCIVFRKEEVLHRLWRMDDKRKIAAIRKQLKGRKIFIADGHHRYEAALNYSRQRQRREKKQKRAAAYDYVMTYLVATTDPGLEILATHRVLRNITGFRQNGFMHKLKKLFLVRRFSTSEALFRYLQQGKGGHLFGIYFKRNNFYGIKLKHKRTVDKFLGNKSPGLNKDLDVTLLHKLAIGRSLNLKPGADDIYYTRDAREAIKLVDSGNYQAAFFLKPTTVAQIKKTASTGQRMPHKSSYFYPKLLTGLVINKFSG